LEKTYSINFKNKIADQNSDFPLNISLYNSFNYNSSDFLAPGTELTFSQRSLFLTQILISNRISDKISLQISPSFIKRNYNRERILFIDNIPTITTYDNKNNYLLGVSSSYKINKRTALNIEYNAKLNRLDNSPNSDVLSIGLDLETGGHVFQLIFSNTQSMDDVSSILDAEGNWSKKHIFFGFNILRVF
jgi:hypothetical protein